MFNIVYVSYLLQICVCLICYKYGREEECEPRWRQVFYSFNERRYV